LQTCRGAGRVWWPVFGSVGVRRHARMRRLKILSKRDECCDETKAYCRGWGDC
jgi:hypothetical protein